MIHYPVTLVGTIVDKFANSRQDTFFISIKKNTLFCMMDTGIVYWAGERFGVPNSGNW